MMQSRLIAIAARSNWAFSLAQFQGFHQGLVSIPSGRTADHAVHAVDENDPAVPSGEPEKSQDVAEPDNAKANYETDPSTKNDSAKADSGKESERGPFASPKPHYASSPRLESTVVGQPSKPLSQQKRTHTSIVDDVSCVGVDGTPWPEDEEDRETDRKEQQEDERDYYKHHKASPLSEIDFVDTRKPITQATDGTADSGYYGGGREVTGWLPEQLDTAEEALLRATEIWKQNAMRGDPDALTRGSLGLYVASGFN